MNTYDAREGRKDKDPGDSKRPWRVLRYAYWYRVRKRWGARFSNLFEWVFHSDRSESWEGEDDSPPRQEPKTDRSRWWIRPHR